jgi:carboxymethylenebutenolidase
MTELKGHLALPERKKGKGLLLVHAWWGLNEFFMGLADRFAEEGFVVFAPDYYNGKVASTIDAAEKFSNVMDEKETESNLKKALKYLSKHPAVTGEKIGILAISLGAWFSVRLAFDEPDNIGAIVLFYGIGGGEFNEFAIPIQCHFAEDDEYEEIDQIIEFKEQVMKGKGKGEFHTYEGTTHWFFESDVINAFHEPSAELAFQRTVAFLKSHL